MPKLLPELGAELGECGIAAVARFGQLGHAVEHVERGRFGVGHVGVFESDRQQRRWGVPIEPEKFLRYGVQGGLAGDELLEQLLFVVEAQGVNFARFGRVAVADALFWIGLGGAAFDPETAAAAVARIGEQNRAQAEGGGR